MPFQIGGSSPSRSCTLFFDTDCGAHQYHLLCGGGLADMDAIAEALGVKGVNGRPPKFYSLLSTILHTWRDNSADIKRRWEDTYKETKDWVKKIPPKPNSDRQCPGERGEREPILSGQPR